MKRVAVAVLTVVLALPATAEEEARSELRLELRTSAIVTGAALAGVLTSELLKDRLVPATCRFCRPNRFDSSIQDALAWSNTGRAATASDLLEIGVPLAAAGTLALAGFDRGGSRRAVEDLVMVSETLSLTLLGTQVVKFATGRLRPYAYHDPAAHRGPDAVLSFWSGHVVTAFTGVAGAAQVARMRGYVSWRWILAVGLVGAGACGYFRIAADAHWATDVLAAAAVGSAAGLGLPVLLHGPREGGGAGLTIAVLPNGLVGTF